MQLRIYWVVNSVDILIIGGGLIGRLLTLALKPLGFNILMVDNKALLQDASVFDARSLALSPASIHVLQTLGIWSLLQDDVTYIHNIHVSEQSAFGQARLLGSEQQPLGAVVEVSVLEHALCTQIAPHEILAPATLRAFDIAAQIATIETSTGEQKISARFVVGADGAHSFLRQCCQLPFYKKDYHQHAIIANIGLARSHQHWAYERFTRQGLWALVPMTGLRAALIWTALPDEVSRLTHLSDQAFLTTLQRTFGYRLGRFVKVGQRSVYPLHQILMRTQVKDSVVFIGNAAHTLHPVAGQGFNLGLRDVAMLVQCFAENGLSPSTLQSYQAQRQADQAIITQLTDGLVKVFNNQLPGVSLVRSLGLTLVDNSAVLKKILSHYASGYGGILSDLVCGIPLSGSQ